MLIWDWCWILQEGGLPGAGLDTLNVGFLHVRVGAKGIKLWAQGLTGDALINIATIFCHAERK